MIAAGGRVEVRASLIVGMCEWVSETGSRSRFLEQRPTYFLLMLSALSKGLNNMNGCYCMYV